MLCPIPRGYLKDSAEIGTGLALLLDQSNFHLSAWLTLFMKPWSDCKRQNAEIYFPTQYTHILSIGKYLSIITIRLSSMSRLRECFYQKYAIPLCCLRWNFCHKLADAFIPDSSVIGGYLCNDSIRMGVVRGYEMYAHFYFVVTNHYRGKGLGNALFLRP